MSIASEPTPPLAPVTTIAPWPGAWPLRSMRSIEPGREAGGAEAHRVGERQALRSRDDPVGRDARVLGIAAVVRLGQPAAGHQHLVARLEAHVDRGHDAAGEVDAA